MCQCEWADYPTSILEKRWPNVPRFRDITTLTKEGFFEKTGRKTITLISGGFPCQPFSSAGAQKGFADTRYLWPEMVRVISELHPSWVLGENVAGFINMGLDKTVFDLERAGYAVQTYVYPACGVGAWHERTRTFIVAAHVSHTPCKRQPKCKGGNEPQCLSIGQWDIPQEKFQRGNMEPSAFSSCILSYADSLGRNKVNVQTGSNDEKQGQGESCRTDNYAGKTNIGNGSAQSRLGGVANGLPIEMDGYKLWKREPVGVPRITEDTENRALRLKTLGNAVCPPQVYPILKCIADIETGACKHRCVFNDL